jgi:hypothetical protein
MLEAEIVNNYDLVTRRHKKLIIKREINNYYLASRKHKLFMAMLNSRINSHLESCHVVNFLINSYAPTQKTR